MDKSKKIKIYHWTWVLISGPRRFSLCSWPLLVEHSPCLSVSDPLPRPTGWLFLPAPLSPNFLYFSASCARVPCCALCPGVPAPPSGPSSRCIWKCPVFLSFLLSVCWYLHFPWIFSSTCWGLGGYLWGQRVPVLPLFLLAWCPTRGDTHPSFVKDI